ncbi:hypothetical protein LOY28_01415 [Pseudomonas sp. B21-017]|uniref:hypothetical protein n=1 Tax=Pseudomonas sp. B21-017 TaxID=2895474 RepID=UPI002160BA6E|nr:hypothetical protein [Pseudomonas sp. B21-017]UVM39122.1 hypothetical protein LOY28_01415 [Pseudomonas sp. B21-017]
MSTSNLDFSQSGHQWADRRASLVAWQLKLMPYIEDWLVEGPHVVFSRQRKPARFELADWVNLGLAGVLGLHFKSLEQVVNVTLK